MAMLNNQRVPPFKLACWSILLLCLSTKKKSMNWIGGKSIENHGCFIRKESHTLILRTDPEWRTVWWFGTFFIFHSIWDNPSHWLMFFRGGETTNQRKYQGILYDVRQREGFDVQWCCEGVNQNKLLLHIIIPDHVASTYHMDSYVINHTVIRVSHRVSRRYQNPPPPWNHQSYSH